MDVETGSDFSVTYFLFLYEIYEVIFGPEAEIILEDLEIILEDLEIIFKETPRPRTKPKTPTIITQNMNVETEIDVTTPRAETGAYKKDILHEAIKAIYTLDKTGGRPVGYNLQEINEYLSATNNEYLSANNSMSGTNSMITSLKRTLFQELKKKDSKLKLKSGKFKLSEAGTKYGTKYLSGIDPP